MTPMAAANAKAVMSSMFDWWNLPPAVAVEPVNAALAELASRPARAARPACAALMLFMDNPGGPIVPFVAPWRVGAIEGVAYVAGRAIVVRVVP